MRLRYVRGGGMRLRYARGRLMRLRYVRVGGMRLRYARGGGMQLRYTKPWTNVFEFNRVLVYISYTFVFLYIFIIYATTSEIFCLIGQIVTFSQLAGKRTAP